MATGGADPAEAMLPAGAAMGLRSHGECTVGLPLLVPLPLCDGVLALLVLRMLCLGCSVASAKGSQGVVITGGSVLFFLASFALALAVWFHGQLLPVVIAFTAANFLLFSSSFASIRFSAFSNHFFFIHIVNSIKANNGISNSNVHYNIGMINFKALFVYSLKGIK